VLADSFEFETFKPYRGLPDHDVHDPFAARPRRPWRVVPFLVVLVLLGGWGVVLLGMPDRPAGMAVAFRDRSVAALLDRMSRALLRGDEPGWLEDVDDSDAWGLRTVYANLRGLGVTRFSMTTAVDDVSPVPASAGVHIDYCLADGLCTGADAPARIDVTVHFSADGNRVRMGRWDGVQQPEPWLATRFTFAAGPRVIIAAAPPYVDRSAAVLSAAEAAATVADRFVAPGPPPGRYVIYLAGPSEWTIWYGGAHGRIRDAAGIAVPTSGSMVDIALRIDRIRPADLRTVVQHEMSHVVTMLGTSPLPDVPDVPVDVVAEGAAEYIAWAGQPVSRYDRLDAVRTFVRGHRWDGRLDVIIRADQPESADARYGIGYLAMHCLAAGYGEDRALWFAEDLLRRGMDFDHAARDALGQPWTVANAKTVACVLAIAGS
jgi:hypothetical protein